MDANALKLQKGPALLAQAGVSLSEAQWFYRSNRASRTHGSGDPRIDAIRGKVRVFLAARQGCGMDLCALA